LSGKQINSINSASILSIPVQAAVFWSVLWWITGHSRVFKPLMANRIGEIQSCTQWHYVPTELNLANHLTRGLNVPELIERRSWWEGPQYLHDEENKWPENKLNQDQARQEVKENILKNQVVQVQMMMV